MIPFRKADFLNRLGILTKLGFSILQHKLTFVPFGVWATNRCNSRCLICNIWNKNPKTDLPAEIVRKILGDRAITRTTFFLLTGGELLLHPECEEIMSLFRGRNYVLLTNALLVERLIEVVRKYDVKRLSISLDGSKETYKRVRGVDGYACVERAVRELRHDTRIRIDYVISPWNSRKDLIHVMKFCEKYQIELGAEYYTDMEYLEIDRPPGHLYDVSDLIDHPYHRLYQEWVEGNLKMPCLSIFAKPSVRPNGDVMLCDQKEVVLGNLHKESLGEIWSSKRAFGIQRQYISCNGCWSDCSRLFDLEILSWAKTFMSRRLLQRIFPDYDWSMILKYLN